MRMSQIDINFSKLLAACIRGPSQVTWARKAKVLGLVSVFSALASTGCITIDLPAASGDLFAGAFIISGTMELDRDNQACSVFHGDNGVKYSLFQGSRLTNEEFDQLFEDDARARLKLDIRSDLDLRCSPNRTVEVVDILEFIPP